MLWRASLVFAESSAFNVFIAVFLHYISAYNYSFSAFTDVASFIKVSCWLITFSKTDYLSSNSFLWFSFYCLSLSFSSLASYRCKIVSFTYCWMILRSWVMRFSISLANYTSYLSFSYSNFASATSKFFFSSS